MVKILHEGHRGGKRPDPAAQVDFGFLEPAALSTLSRLARSGGKIPATLTGKLAVRVALGYDTLAALHQQLGQVVAGLRAERDEKAPAKKEVKH